MKKLFIKVVAVVCLVSAINLVSGKSLYKQKAFYDPGTAASKF